MMLPLPITDSFPLTLGTTAPDTFIYLWSPAGLQLMTLSWHMPVSPGRARRKKRECMCVCVLTCQHPAGFREMTLTGALVHRCIDSNVCVVFSCACRRRRGRGARQIELPEHISRMMGHANLLYASNKWVTQWHSQVVIQALQHLPAHTPITTKPGKLPIVVEAWMSAVTFLPQSGACSLAAQLLQGRRAPYAIAMLYELPGRHGSGVVLALPLSGISKP